MLTTEQVQNYGLWLQSGAIIVSLVGVTIAAWISRGIARRRATLDLIMMEQSNDFQVKTRQQFIALREAGHLVQWASPANAATAEAAVLRAILNRYELIAIGIQEKTLDERVSREYGRTTLLGIGLLAGRSLFKGDTISKPRRSTASLRHSRKNGPSGTSGIIADSRAACASV